MINKLIKLNMWYDNLADTRGILRFLIFLLMMVVVFVVLPQPFQILSLIALLSLRLLANYAQRNKLQIEIEENKLCRAVVKDGHQAQ